MLSIISTIWHVIGTFVIVALVSAVAPTHQSAHYVFTSLNVPDVGISNHGYVFFLGLLMSQFCITGCAVTQSCTQRSGSLCQNALAALAHFLTVTLEHVTHTPVTFLQL